MSCANKTFSNDYDEYIRLLEFIRRNKTQPNSFATLDPQRINDPFSFSSLSNSSAITREIRGCRTSVVPSFVPELFSLSKNSSEYATYSNVFVYGSNFLPNATAVLFGDYGIVSVQFLSSFQLSFSVPDDALPGTYNVKVVNIYNNNFSQPVKQIGTGKINASTRSISYTITEKPKSV